MAMMATREFKAKKAENFSEWYNTVIYAADLVDDRYNVQGFLVHKPGATRAIRGIYAIFEKELEADGHEPVLFPTVIPEENFLKEKEHVEGFAPEVFWITQMGSTPLHRKLALRPTSETAFYQMYSLWVKTAADLPLKFYQSCSVFRGEKETNPFLRGREFYWIETHDAFASKDESVEQVKRDNVIYRRVIFDGLGVPIHIFRRPQWDKFAGADDTFAYDAYMPDGKVLQIGSTHLLGQNFAKPFGIEFADEKGEKHYAWQTCFGPGIWRIMAALIATHGDDHGLIFPLPVAPVQIVIVPILKGETAGVVEKAKEIEQKLCAAGLRAKADLSDKTPGFKFNEWELRGVPLRIELGGRELAQGAVTLVRRDNREKITVKEDELVGAIEKAGAALLDALRAKAKSEFDAHLSEAWDKDSLKKTLNEKKGVVRTAFCSTQMDGKPCADELQSFTVGGKVRGNLAFLTEDAAGKSCVWCGRPAKEIVYVARQY